MKKSKLRLTLALLVSIFVLFTVNSASLAESPIKKVDKRAITEVKAKPMKLACDVSIMYIEFFNCPCELDMDVFYVSDRIAVKLFNESTLSPNVKLTVKYFDIPSNRIKTITKNVTFAGRSSKKVTVINRPLLIKKSYGVKAEVEVTSANMVDPDLSNNESEQLLCGQVPE